MRQLLLTLCCPVLLLLAVGCGPQTTSQRLTGEWVGRPDTFAAQRERNPIPTAPGAVAVKQEPTQPPARPTKAQEKLDRLQPSESTDLEAYDFTISLHFHKNGEVAMSLDGRENLAGQWQILSTDVGVSRLEISLGKPGEPLPDAKTGGQEPAKRVFTLKMNDSDSGDGFTLREEGADIRFGWLYFQRPNQSPTKKSKPQPEVSNE